MTKLQSQRVVDVQHWNEHLFSFKTTRDSGFRFRNGHFIMLGLPGEKRPVMRAYSIASPNHDEHLEFFSIKVPEGALTSKLQALQPGDEVLLSSKPVGTLVLDDLRPGKRLLLLATGTGLAPFLSVIQDPETYERFEQVILVHGVRRIVDLAYREFIENDLPQHEYLGDLIGNQLHYYPTVTREAFVHQGRIPELLKAGKIFADLDLAPINAQTDRAMLCGSPNMLGETAQVLGGFGLEVSPQQGVTGDYVIERAFVEK